MQLTSSKKCIVGVVDLVEPELVPVLMEAPAPELAPSASFMTTSIGGRAVARVLEADLQHFSSVRALPSSMNVIRSL
jgi:hypothetical protein